MRILFLILILPILLWCGAFAWFLHSVPRVPLTEDVRTDAIVVLTGGSLRIAYGFELLEKGKANKLLITGVGRDSTLASLLEANKASPELRAMAAEGLVTIALDYSADSTRGNAEGSAEWVKKNNLHSLRLVTANYHVPRSLVEFRRLMPEVEMVADPVFPEPFKTESWWEDKTSRDLMLSEFHKYLVARLYWELV